MSEPRLQVPEPAEVDRELGAWGVLWASAILFSLVSSPARFRFLLDHSLEPVPVLELATGAASLWVILRPARPPVLALLAVLHLLEIGLLLPEVPNHRLILAFVDLALLAAVSGSGARSSLDRFAPAARAITVVVYAFAVFAKLNRDFLDPGSSCALRFYRQTADWWPLPPVGAAVESVVIYGTLAVEGFLVLALSWQRLRRIGVAVGLAFHVALAFDVTQNLVNFSAVMLALLVLFLPREFCAALSERIDGESRARPLLVGGFLLVFAGGLYAVASWHERAVVYYWTRQLLWSTYAGGVALAALLTGEGERIDRGRPVARSSLAASVAVALAVVNGLGPYLGWKTRTAFDMYSNLRLEAARSNHLLVPRSLDLLGLLADPVQLLDSSDVWLDRLAKRDEEIPYFELARRLDEVGAVRVRYRRKGEERSYDSATLGPPPDAPRGWRRKLVVFRALGESSRGECLW